jgi:ornithine cyclodeaminase
MVRFVDVADMRRWVTEHGISGVLRGMADAIEDDFRRWPEFDTTARVASHSPVGVIELMPVSDGRLYAFKYVNGHPSNPGRGLQTVTAFGVLADVATGYPLLLSEMTLLTPCGPPRRRPWRPGRSLARTHGSWRCWEPEARPSSRPSPSVSCSA